MALILHPACRSRKGPCATLRADVVWDRVWGRLAQGHAVTSPGATIPPPFRASPPSACQVGKKVQGAALRRPVCFLVNDSRSGSWFSHYTLKREYIQVPIRGWLGRNEMCARSWHTLGIFHKCPLVINDDDNYYCHSLFSPPFIWNLLCANSQL